MHLSLKASGLMQFGVSVGNRARYGFRYTDAILQM